MAGTDAKGMPTFANTDAANFAVDLTKVSDAASDRLDPSVDMVMDLPSSGNWEGRELWVSGVAQKYTWTNTGWVNTAGIRGTFVAPTMNTSAPAWTWGAGSSLTRRLDEIRLDALFSRAVGITALVVICTLPVGARPSQPVGFNGVLVSGGSTGFFSGVVNTDGTVVTQAVSNTTSTAARVNISFRTDVSW